MREGRKVSLKRDAESEASREIYHEQQRRQSTKERSEERANAEYRKAQSNKIPINTAIALLFP